MVETLVMLSCSITFNIFPQSTCTYIYLFIQLFNQLLFNPSFNKLFIISWELLTHARSTEQICIIFQLAKTRRVN